MTYVLLAALRPSLLDPLHAAALPTDPPALAAYTLLAWFVVLVWLGNRGSGKEEGGSSEDPGPDSGGDASSSGTVEAEEPDSRSQAADVGRRHRGEAAAGRRKSGTKKLSRKQRRRRGHINWIQ